MNNNKKARCETSSFNIAKEFIKKKKEICGSYDPVKLKTIYIKEYSVYNNISENIEKYRFSLIL